MCRKARRQFMALLLNVGSGKLALCNCLEDGRMVGDVIAEIDSLLQQSPDRGACEYAKSLADGINTGEAVVPCDGSTERITAMRTQAPPTAVIPASPGSGLVLRYELPGPEHVRLDVYDKAGRFLRRLVDEDQRPGSYEIQWDGRDERGETVPSGICFYRIETGRAARSGKVILLR
jgi:hypothetical protein